MPPERSAHRPGLVLLVVASAQALAVASASIVSVALPTIAPALDASPAEQQWIVDAYVLVVASLLVAGGVLGDRRGRRGAFLAGLGLFAAGSVVCALAPSTELLLAGRVLQGLGPPLVLPASLAIVTAANPDPARRARAIGLWSAGSGLGMTLGPLLGGLLVESLGWRSVFAFNVVAALGLALVAVRVVPRVAPAASGERFDVGGAVLTTLAVGALAFAIIEGRGLGWTSAPILATAALALVAAAAFVAWERGRRAPLVDVALLRRPVFMAANLGAAAVFFALIGATVYLASFLQLVQGRSALEAGAVLLPLGAGVAAGAPLSGRLVGRFGARAPMLGGLVLAAAGTAALHLLSTGTTWAAMAPVFLATGLGVGLSLPPATATAVAAVEPARAGMASAVHNTVRQLGQALGVAVLGSIVFAGLGGDAPSGVLAAAQADAFVGGLRTALVVCAATLVAAALLVAAVVPGRPRAPTS